MKSHSISVLQVEAVSWIHSSSSLGLSFNKMKEIRKLERLTAAQMQLKWKENSQKMAHTCECCRCTHAVILLVYGFDGVLGCVRYIPLERSESVIDAWYQEQGAFVCSVCDSPKGGFRVSVSSYDVLVCNKRFFPPLLVIWPPQVQISSIIVSRNLLYTIIVGDSRSCERQIIKVTSNNRLL